MIRAGGFRHSREVDAPRVGGDDPEPQPCETLTTSVPPWDIRIDSVDTL